jgi:hypothetical protein
MDEYEGQPWIIGNEINVGLLASSHHSNILHASGGISQRPSTQMCERERMLSTGTYSNFIRLPRRKWLSNEFPHPICQEYSATIQPDVSSPAGLCFV